ncbi:glycoprotein 3-alpha-L-fucosyltransferase A-like [Dreissena polymorpha]|uniref:glycoprotein 3-alpha-L-fucosyltransferase A-like n=1 Tax=Dreissena polymorpha TaxID=45954 RepID=UPI0022645C57|nr:glycoprotein 3-alpha-L-fucosyltransferase A-like [Dreissena polymorpha]
MIMKCRRIHTKFILPIGLFIVLSLALNFIPQDRILHKNVIIFRLPHLNSTFFPNQSTTVVTRSSEPVHIWQQHPYDDRILMQAEFRPNVDFDNLPPKRILLAAGLDGWGVNEGNHAFVEHQCPVQNCRLHEYPPYKKIIDARIFKEMEIYEDMSKDAKSVVPRHPNQIWIMFGLESPAASPNYANVHDVINWTATYRYDSTIVTPYDKFQTYENFTKLSYYKPIKNFAASKKKMAAIFMSNCYAVNNRLDVVKELQKFIDVDIYGHCGTLTCERGKEKMCFKKLKDEYKFYLSFENANCRDYITEKLFLNALR